MISCGKPLWSRNNIVDCIDAVRYFKRILKANQQNTYVILFSAEVYIETRQHFSRMRAACLPTVRVSVATTRCQYWLGSRVSKSHVWRQGAGYPGPSDLDALPPPPPRMTDTRENITFQKLPWRAIKILIISEYDSVLPTNKYIHVLVLEGHYFHFSVVKCI